MGLVAVHRGSTHVARWADKDPGAGEPVRAGESAGRAMDVSSKSAESLAWDREFGRFPKQVKNPTTAPQGRSIAHGRAGTKWKRPARHDGRSAIGAGRRARAGGTRNGLPEGGSTSLERRMRGAADDAKEGGDNGVAPQGIA